MKSSLYCIYQLLDDQERTIALYSNKGQIFMNFMTELGNHKTIGFWKHCYFRRNVSWIFSWKLLLGSSCDTSIPHSLFSNYSLKGNVQRWTCDKTSKPSDKLLGSLTKVRLWTALWWRACSLRSWWRELRGKDGG